MGKNGKNPLSRTELAIEQQPGLLGLDWTSKLSPKTRTAARGARSLTFIGTGSSFHAALWAAWLARQASAGKLEARAVSTWDLLAANLAATAPKTELFVMISHRGDVDLTRRALATFGKRHVLVCAERAPAGKHPCLRTSSAETSAAHTMSLMAAMAACSELVAAVLPARAAEALRTSRERAAVLLQGLALDAESLGEALGGIIVRGAGLHFVGGAAFHAIALELALKAREMIHVPAHGYNTEEFLHGPLASVAEDDTVVALEPLAAEGKASALEQLLVHERMAACRKAAEAVGALVLEPAWEGEPSREIARLAAPWQALLALYWGQMLCLSTAKSWDIDPDVNRRDDPRYEEAHRRAQL